MGGQGDGYVSLGVQDTHLGSEGMAAVSSVGKDDRSWSGYLCNANAGATFGRHLECDCVEGDERICRRSTVNATYCVVE